MQKDGNIFPIEYQALASRTEKPLPFEGRLQHAMLGIITEAGELGDLIKKIVIYNQPFFRDEHAAKISEAKKFVLVENIEEELGDLLWYVALMANATGIDLGKVMQMNIAKLRARYPEKYTDEHAAARLDKPAGQ